MARGKTLWLAVVGILALLATGCEPATNPKRSGGSAGLSVEAVRERITAAWSQHHSMSARMVTTTRQTGVTGVVEGREEGPVDVLRQDGQELVRADLKVTRIWKTATRDETRGYTITTIADGQGVEELIRTAGELRSSHLPADRSPLVTVTQLFERHWPQLEAELRSDETLDGQAVFVIAAVRKPGGAFETPRATFYVQKDSGVLAKYVFIGDDGQPVQTTAFHSIRLDVPIDPARLAPRPAESRPAASQPATEPATPTP